MPLLLLMTELPGDRLDINDVRGQLKVRIVPGALHHAFLLQLHPRSVLLVDVLELHLLQRGVLGDVRLPVKLGLRIVSGKGPPVFFLAGLFNHCLDPKDVVVVISTRGTEVKIALALIYKLVEY